MNKTNNKVRVNLTLDKENLEKAKKKLELFGGKLSTLFNLYLKDFVESIGKDISDTSREMNSKITELDKRIRKLEEKSGK